MNLDLLRRRLAPTSDEAALMVGKTDRLLAACQRALDDAGVAAKASLQGSLAKGTWLSGSTDADLFMLLDPETPAGELDGLAATIGQSILEGSRCKYAQHPYVVGTFEELQVDLVPAYAIDAPHDRMSAVDRTPFHTTWVNETLDDTQKADVRLLKQWCKGVGVYGAETAIGGFSGYLLEVLVGALGSFEAVIAHLAGGPSRVAVGRDEVKEPEDAVWIVVDPVDATRNCAAAIRPETLQLAVEAAQAWQQTPAERFLHPVPVRPEAVQRLSVRLRDGKSAWVGLELTPATDRLDLVAPQFQRAARMLAESMERAGFRVQRTAVDIDEERPWIGMQWLLDGGSLPATVIHMGPPVDKEPNGRRFRSKWQEHADREGDLFEQDGHLAVRLRNKARRPGEWLETNLETLHLPKHVAACLGSARLHKVPSVDSLWAPAVTAFIQGLRPWQRT